MKQLAISLLSTLSILLSACAVPQSQYAIQPDDQLSCFRACDAAGGVPLSHDMDALPADHEDCFCVPKDERVEIMSPPASLNARKLR